MLSAFSGVTDSLFAAGRAAVAGDEPEALVLLDAMIQRHRVVAVDLLGAALPAAVEAAIAAAEADLGAVLKGAALLRALPERSLDILAGRGELLSTAILAAYIGAPWIDARTVMRTDSRFGSAKPLTEEIGKLAAEKILPLVGPGKIAVTRAISGPTLGRAHDPRPRGSDYSASLFGAAIGASEIQIWTDVEGILTCDPASSPPRGP